MTKTVVVAGGAGFIGCNFVRAVLAQTDWHVVVLDKLTYAGNLLNLADVAACPRYAFVRGDIGDPRIVKPLLESSRPFAIVNFAAESHVDRSIDGPRSFLETNVVGTFELLDAARCFWSRLKGLEREGFRFLHVSTDEVYGSLGESGRFTEETAYSPNSPYAASKAASDHFVHAYHQTYSMPTVVTNCSNNYGPFQFPEKLIPLTIHKALSGKHLPIYGDGRNIRDWLHVEDHCTALLTVLRHGRVGSKYNIGGRSEWTNLQVVAEICDALDHILPAKQNPALTRTGIINYFDLKTFVPDRPGHDRRYAIDSSLVEKELQWTAQVGFREGIHTTVEWYVRNSKWCHAVCGGTYGGERLGRAVEHGAP
jgi:dTDP-glucose 4,6-dehydratase